jgi:16S rRNA (guanine527-N7)-methyltransferase
VLVESVAKKCAFLREAIAATGADAEVRHGRVETIEPVRPEVITARALASLPQLFAWGMRHARADTIWVLPKGARHGEEVYAAREDYDFAEKLVPSMTDAAARIVVARGVRRAR